MDFGGGRDTHTNAWSPLPRLIHKYVVWTYSLMPQSRYMPNELRRRMFIFYLQAFYRECEIATCSDGRTTRWYFCDFRPTSRSSRSSSFCLIYSSRLFRTFLFSRLWERFLVFCCLLSSVTLTVYQVHLSACLVQSAHYVEAFTVRSRRVSQIFRFIEFGFAVYWSRML